MSDSVTKLAEEIEQLRVSRAREETVRAKGACVGEARKKPGRAEVKPLPEGTEYQGENMSERRNSVGTPVERPLKRQSQGGRLCEDGKRFMAGAFDFMGLGHGTCDEHPREADICGMNQCKREEVMVQQNFRRRGRNRKPRLGLRYDESCEYYDPRMYEMEKAQSQPQTYRE